MIELSPTQLAPLVEASDLFQELLHTPDGRRYRQALQRARAWSLEPGESLPEGECALVVLAGSAGLGSLPEGEPPAGPPRRVFGQWSGLRDAHSPGEVTAWEPSTLLQCSRELLELLLGEAASRFKAEFYRPLVQGLNTLPDVAPEVLDEAIRRSRFRLHQDGAPIVREGDHGSTMFIVLAGRAEVQLQAETTPILGVGDFFGEAAMLTYQRRRFTVAAQGPCLAMELDRVVAGDLRRKSKHLKRLMEERFRERALTGLLRSAEFFGALYEEELQTLAQIATLETYQQYEPLFFQGDPADALYLVLNGTVSVVEESPEGPRATGWARSGDPVGEFALLPHLTGSDRRTRTVTALQRVDAIRIPADEFHKLAATQPTVLQKLEATAQKRLRDNAEAQGNTARTDRLAWMMDTQYVAGNAVLAVDMNDCIRCNNCVTACESVHADGLNRFHWGRMRADEGLLPHTRLSNSCQHCEYALCMAVCPTHCIKRDAEGAVFIDYDLCIRCGKCADPSFGCPYGSIYTVPAEEVAARPAQPVLLQMLDRLLGRAPASVAAGGEKTGKNYPVKCDLCHELPIQACIHHCPTGAVFRIDGHVQFETALRSPMVEDPSRESLPLFLQVGIDPEAVAGKPAPLRVEVRREGDGERICCLKPEVGVESLVLNFYLDSPDEMRVGGGPLRQLTLPVDDPEGSVEYSLTSRTATQAGLQLAIYQGGLFLGHVPVEAGFAAAPAKEKAA